MDITVISKAKRLLPVIMEAEEVPILVGHAGVGKTDIVKQIGKETDREVKILVLSQMEPGDLLGMPARDGDHTVWLKPDWFPRSDNEILFLDEINRASDITRAAVMQLLLDRKLNDHVLPKGVWVVAAMNPDTEKYELNQIIDQAFIDRFVWIKITNTLDDFREFAQNSKYRNDVYLEALNRMYDMDYTVFQMDNDFELLEIVPTPRAHMRAMKLVNRLGISDDLEEVLSGIIGKKYAKDMIQIMKDLSINPLTSEDLIKGNVEKVRASTPIDRINAIDQLIPKIRSSSADWSGEQIDNLTKALNEFDKEQLGPIIREAQKNLEFAKLIVYMKKKSKAFSKLLLKMLSDDVTGKIEIAKLIK